LNVAPHSQCQRVKKHAFRPATTGAHGERWKTAGLPLAGLGTTALPVLAVTFPLFVRVLALLALFPLPETVLALLLLLFVLALAIGCHVLSHARLHALRKHPPECAPDFQAHVRPGVVENPDHNQRHKTNQQPSPHPS